MARRKNEAETGLICVGRLPRVREDIESLRACWEAHALDAGRMLCTEDNVQSVRAMRAALRHEFETVDAARKKARERYMSPWAEVERVWDECVEGPFRRADTLYRDAVTACDNRLRDACLKELTDFYASLQDSAGLGWLPLDRAAEAAGLRLTPGELRAGGVRRAMKQLTALAERVRADRDQLSRLEDADALLAEYRLTLDLGAAVANVQERRRREREERLLLERSGADAPKRCSFTVLGCGSAQLGKIRDFLRAEGIRFE